MICLEAALASFSLTNEPKNNLKLKTSKVALDSPIY